MNIYTTVNDNKLQMFLPKEGKDALFVDWIPTYGSVEQRNKQLDSIANAIDNRVSVIVFDRHRSLTPNEIKWLKPIAILTEPCVIPKKGFRYLPIWFNQIEPSIELFEYDRSIESAPYDKNEDWSDVKIAYIKGSDIDCKCGYIPDLSVFLENGTIPMIHQSHRWYHSLFNGYVYNNDRDIVFNGEMYQYMGYGSVKHIYNNIDTYHPEMFTHNFVNILVDMFEKG